jgi:hypothetical protein
LDERFKTNILGAMQASIHEHGLSKRVLAALLSGLQRRVLRGLDNKRGLCAHIQIPKLRDSNLVEDFGPLVADESWSTRIRILCWECCIRTRWRDNFIGLIHSPDRTIRDRRIKKSRSSGAFETSDDLTRRSLYSMSSVWVGHAG